MTDYIPPPQAEIPNQDHDMDDRDLPPILGGEKEAIAADYKNQGGNEIICLSILDTIPESKQHRVSHWFLSGGQNGDYDVELFLAFFKDKFNNKLALQTAGSELQRMRMGSSQGFELFLTTSS
ncbi:hypothetical protein K3495_g10546 [Podosphaera aphanis]|nr:hypothetical protein K3495_g10546 [Podosphaera aphanis]